MAYGITGESRPAYFFNNSFAILSFPDALFPSSIYNFPIAHLISRGIRGRLSTTRRPIRVVMKILSYFLGKCYPFSNLPLRY